LNPLKIWLDSHDPFPGSPGNSERLFFYSRYASGPKSVNLDFFRKLLFENGGYVFDRQPMYGTIGQTSTSWVDSMITSVELPLSLETGWVNRTDNVQWTIPLYNFNGEVLAKGMCDYLNNIIRPGDIILDNNDTLNGVQITGQWVSSTFIPGYWGNNYIHDNNTGKGLKSIKYSPNIQQTGIYEVFLRWTQDSGRAANVPIRIFYSGIIKDTIINQKTKGSEWVSMGYFELASGNQNYVLIKNDNTSQFVIADAVRFSLRDNCDPISVNAHGIEIPENYILYQNYPNPFNPVANIKVQAAKSGWIKLIIYDVNGREVKSLYDNLLGHEIKEYVWDGGDNASGVYYYSLIADDKVIDTKKMLLIK
jgi:hypothetical protein